MIITAHLDPRLSYRTLDVRRDGTAIILNGQRLDLGRLAIGDVLPGDAVDSYWVTGPCRRTDDGIVIDLFLPVGPNAPKESVFPAPLAIQTDGPVALPAWGAEGTTTPEAEIRDGDVAVDWSRVETATARAQADLDAARTSARSKVVAMIEAAANAVTGPVPEAERASWPAKGLAARAVLADTATPEDMAMIEAEADVTGETPAELASTIVAKADAYQALAGRLTGLRRNALKAVAEAKAPEAVEAAVGALAAALRS